MCGIRGWSRQDGAKALARLRYPFQTSTKSFSEISSIPLFYLSSKYDIRSEWGLGPLSWIVVTGAVLHIHTPFLWYSSLHNGLTLSPTRREVMKSFFQVMLCLARGSPSLATQGRTYLQDKWMRSNSLFSWRVVRPVLEHYVIRFGKLWSNRHEIK